MPRGFTDKPDDKRKVKVPLKPSQVNTIKKLASKGVAPTDIAKLAQTSPTRVRDVMASLKEEAKELQEYKDKRADVFTLIQKKAHNIISKVLDTYTDTELSVMTAANKNGLLATLNALSGTVFDKERLLRGQSTANVNIITQAISKLEATRKGRPPNEEKAAKLLKSLQPAKEPPG